MPIVSLHIERIEYSDAQILGEMHVLSKNGVECSFKTLELPDLNNQPLISCIPKGIYVVKKRYSPKFGMHLHILDVPNRDYILIHRGNFVREILGCILIGLYHVDIDSDGLKDVTSSRIAMNKLMKSINQDRIALTIG